MSKFSKHPATQTGSYRVKNVRASKPKDRQPTIEQIKEQRRLKKLKKKRRK